MLPVPPTGTLTNPYPSIDSTVALSNWVITLTGSALDVLPESLIFTSDTDPGISYKATLKDGATAAKASYDLNPAPADKAKVPTTLTINKQPGDPVEASKQITIKK